MFGEQLLRVVRPVKRIAVFVVARTGVIATDDKMRAAVVLANDGVPQRFARTTHAHGKVQQAQLGGLLRILLEHVLVTAHAREMINVAGLGHADHRLNQQIGFDVPCGAESQFLMRPVQRIAGLKRNDLAPAQFAKTTAQFRWRIAQQLEIVISRRLDTANLARQDKPGSTVFRRKLTAGWVSSVVP